LIVIKDFPFSRKHLAISGSHLMAKSTVQNKEALSASHIPADMQLTKQLPHFVALPQNLTSRVPALDLSS
jgi:hypothetical protein